MVTRTKSLPTGERSGHDLSNVVAVAAEHAAEVDSGGRFPVEALAALRASGLMGLLVPVEHGGLGGGLTDLVEVAGELGGACLSTSLIWTMHCQQVDVLVRHAQPELRERLLPRIAAGEVYLGSVTTESTVGGHLLTSESPLHAEQGHYRLTRRAPIVTGAAHADGFLIKMLASPEAAAQEVSMVYLDRADLDIEVRGAWDTLGMRGVENLELTLTGQVTDERLIGGRGKFREIAVECMGPIAHLSWSASWLGATRKVWSALLAHLRRPISKIDLRDSLTAVRVARVRAKLEAVSAYLHTVRAEVERHRAQGSSLGSPATQIHLNTLKVLAAEECLAAATAMIQLAGLDTGYRRDSPVPLERLLRDLTAASLTYSDTRLLTANGALSVLDPAVTLAGAN
ncbi:acyl-CoA/acyl-ACP dehydrogenase [Crossiella sp. SN42]|uniref:acyl-CoA dehydrogenase family protein n=1 Tax=Crossiella sp. SN42 TaxID=2944808 RepID=UPI00207D5F3E|nr:acyl-CoA dehydrogenase family protein [Crossiella sp. SN42]MCO1580269.1 acyl-CoA/acyl-ACP dehydrogenase [Crossiella sp. SN42]